MSETVNSITGILFVLLILGAPLASAVYLALTKKPGH